ncbi:cytochrome-c oxidase, cbb3-type subunit III [Meridianimarinicoccus sp. RP-17]|uniref:cytochrome-c oxidase, cbb3-type subunit III n=1 Tax=Meridianimarinicoccus zhengii TaxID=2056810 RepID=UPI000DABD4C3|nr:cytochrome-c oxidase, cbb3-type subunit III [Phycocomes zhengii]
MSKTHKDPHDKQDVQTTGHSWDGIEEYDNPMPRWWLYTFYATIVWGIGYTIAFPAWPMISGATSGLLGFSTRGDLVADLERAQAANAEINERLVSVALTEIPDDPDLNQYAVNKGAAVYRTFCSQCHGSGAAGVQAAGYPNLLDDDWLWGGTVEEIHYTISHGIRNEDDIDARYSEMPVYGEILSDEEIEQVAHYAYTLNGRDPLDADMAAAGEETFLYECAACHMEDGSGNSDLGAPALNDAIWLYGGDYETIVETVTYSRYGVMPPWQNRLTEADIAAVATYVHQLGGGVTEE